MTSAERMARYRIKHPARIKARATKYRHSKKGIAAQQEYYRKNKDRIKHNAWQQKLKIRYNLTLEEYEQMKKYQKGKCKICLRERPLHIDHCHKNGKVRGLLCMPCNSALGGVNDNIELLKTMIEYLYASRAS